MTTIHQHDTVTYRDVPHRVLSVRLGLIAGPHARIECPVQLDGPRCPEYGDHVLTSHKLLTPSPSPGSVVVCLHPCREDGDPSLMVR